MPDRTEQLDYVTTQIVLGRLKVRIGQHTSRVHTSERTRMVHDGAEGCELSRVAHIGRASLHAHGGAEG